MSDTIIWWTGAVAIGAAVLGLSAIALVFLWANLIHDRFSAIFFRKTQRRISLASWHRTRLLMKGGGEPPADEWPADDHVIGPHPFYLSYRIGKRRLFIMAGTLGEWRNSSIRGTHP